MVEDLVVKAEVDFRSALAQRTRAAHLRVEEAFAAHDLATEHGMACALNAHLAAMERLLPALNNHASYHAEVSRLRDVALCAADAAGQQSAVRVAGAGPDFHPLAVAYVIFGSRLGAAVITRDLDRRAPWLNKTARQFFADRGSSGHWADLKKQLQSVSDSAEQSQIITDAERVFGVFAEAAVAAHAISAGTHAS